MVAQSILVLGATGFVGSHIILELKKQHPSLPVTVYIRNNKVDAYMTDVAGVKRVEHGSFDDLDRVSSLAAEHDVVVNVASSGDTALTQAIITGLKRRPAGSRPATLVHMSGTANYLDRRWTDGVFHEEVKVWNDGSVEDMKLISPEMPNGGPDSLILNTTADSNINAYIIQPSGIFGDSAGPAPTRGVMYNFVRDIATKLGYVPYMNDGSAVFNTLPLRDVVDFTMRVLSDAVSSSPAATAATTTTPHERVYAVGDREEAWSSIAAAFARAFHAEGLVDSPEPRGVEPGVLAGTVAGLVMASSMRFVSPRAESAGFVRSGFTLAEYLEQSGRAKAA